MLSRTIVRIVVHAAFFVLYTLTAETLLQFTQSEYTMEAIQQWGSVYGSMFAT